MVYRNNTGRLGFWLHQCVLRNTLAGSKTVVSTSRNHPVRTGQVLTKNISLPRPQSIITMIELLEVVGALYLRVRGRNPQLGPTVVQADSNWNFGLRVDFYLKTDSEYSMDAEVTLFTLVNPGSSLRFNTSYTHWSAPSVSTLARGGGVNLNLNKELEFLGLVEFGVVAFSVESVIA